MKYLVTVTTLIACACLLAACSDDDNVPTAPEEPQGHWEEITIGNWEYENNRFFRLDLPAYQAHENLGYTRADDPGRDPAAEFIDITTIRVYRNLGTTPAEGNDVAYAAATADTTGRWGPDFLATVPDDDWVSAWTWRPLEIELLRDVNGDVVAVDLQQEMQDTDILAVVYRVVDASGDPLYTVGDHPDLGGFRGLDIQGQGYYRFKLLKPEQRDPFTFQYVLRNIYSLGISNIDVESFELRIESRAAGLDHPDQHGTQGLTYLRLFGLDRERPNGDQIPDGVVDKHRHEIFDLARGLLKFPVDFPFPFDDVEAVYRANASTTDEQWEWEGTDLAASIEDGVAFYDWQTRPQDYPQTGRFQLVVRHWVWDPAPADAPAPDRVSLARTDWSPASLPVSDIMGGIFAEDRAADIRWYVPSERVVRYLLEPELEGRARDGTVTTLEVAVNSGGDPWEWAGAMTGFTHPGLDLTKVNRLEIWINDFAAEPEDRHGTLHVDLGTIDEDFQWRFVDGSVEFGTFQFEDLNRDGIFTSHDEDVGLDALIGSSQDVVEEGMAYMPDRILGGFPGEYPRINATAQNNREDTEDLDGDSRFGRENRYLSWAIDLAGDEALVDAAVDHPDADLRGTAWRQYAVLLADGDRVEKYESEFLDRFSHLRIWIENDDGTASRRYQVARVRFR